MTHIIRHYTRHSHFVCFLSLIFLLAAFSEPSSAAQRDNLLGVNSNTVAKIKYRVYSQLVLQRGRQQPSNNLQRIPRTPSIVGRTHGRKPGGGKGPNRPGAGNNDGPDKGGGGRRPRPRFNFDIIIDRDPYVAPKKRRKAAPKKPRKRRVKKRKKKRTRTVKKAASPQQAYVKNQVVVMLRRSASKATANQLARTHNLKLLETINAPILGAPLVKYKIRDGSSVPRVVSRMRKDRRVRAVQPNYYHRQQPIKTRKNVKNSNAKGAKKSSRPQAQYALSKLSIPSAHEMATGQGVLIALIDTGVDVSHPALQNAIAAKFNAVGDKEYKAHKHGTAVAGVIAGQGQVQGVAPNAKLLAIRAFYVTKNDPKPKTTSTILVRSAQWAADRGARLVNLSFAGARDPLLEETLQNIHEKGTILVASAGNGGAKAPPAYPAAYSNVLAITAIDKADKLYKNANQGRYLTASAPGVDILAPIPNKHYAFATGTSFASAHVSGIIALMLERDPQISSSIATEALISTAHDLGPRGFDTLFGAGRTDALAALKTIFGKTEKQSQVNLQDSK